MIGETRTLVILVVVVCAFLGAIGQVFFKMGADLISADITSWLPKILVGFGLYGLSSILFILALRHGNLTLLYLIIATSYIWTMTSERMNDVNTYMK